MVKYMNANPKCNDWAKAAKSRGNSLRVHFKNTHETAACLKGMNVTRAKKFLKNVIKKKEIVPFRRFTGGVGRDGQLKGSSCSSGRWPRKSCLFLLDLVRNAEVNARQKNLKNSRLIISHIAVQRARQNRRRTYRAHGRINPFNSKPCHVELFVEEKQKKVRKSSAETDAKKKNKLQFGQKSKALRRNIRQSRRQFNIFQG